MEHEAVIARLELNLHISIIELQHTILKGCDTPRQIHILLKPQEFHSLPSALRLAQTIL